MTFSAMEEACCVADYILGNSARKVATSHGTTHHRVLKIVNAAGVARNKKEAKNNFLGKECLSGQEKLDIAKSYADGKSAQELALVYNRSGGYIGDIVRERGSTRSLEEAQRVKHGTTTNEAAFDDLNSEGTAYFLGFIAGDGNVYKNRLSVTLHSKDTGHVDKLKTFTRF